MLGTSREVEKLASNANDWLEETRHTGGRTKETAMDLQSEMLGYKMLLNSQIFYRINNII